MPEDEVWHRHVPNLFPFGETPFIEAEMSRQIHADLRQGNVFSNFPLPPPSLPKTLRVKPLT